MKAHLEKSEECCPVFDSSLWEDKRFEWDRKRFIKDKVLSIFYVPINYGMVMNRLHERVRKAGGSVPSWLCLSEHTSRWNIDQYLAVDKEIPQANNVVLSGKYYSKVYEGSYSNMEKWRNDFESATTAKGLIIKRLFMWYTTCPKCAKKYGKNFVVIIAHVE